MTYPIIPKLPPKTTAAPLDTAKIRETLRVLPVGGGFVIPLAECLDADGRFRTTIVGQRVRHLARVEGVKITTEKIVEGLRVKRES